MHYQSGASGIAYEALIGAIGAPALADTILSFADAVVGADEVFAYVLDASRVPRAIASSRSVADYADRAAGYTHRFHRFDPLFRLAADETGVIRRARVGVEEIGDRDYRRLCYERPAFAEKFSYSRWFEGGTVVLSIYRRQGRERRGIGDLDGFAEMVLPMLRRHGEIVGNNDGPPVLQRLDRRLAEHFPTLSPRERAVCGRTMIGMTAEAIGLDLDIRKSSVLTYRRRAYERYGFSNANQFLAKLLC